MTRRKVTALLAAFAAAALTLGGCDPPPGGRPEPAPERPAPAHHRGHGKHHAGAAKGRDGGAEGTPAGVPEKAMKVLRHVDESRAAPEGYEGGRDFHNAGADAGQGLPRADAHGGAITYREWDVNPRRRGANRGAERLVTGSDGSAYYTADHYRTFTKVR